MNLMFRFFKDRGNPTKERVVLQALADDNIGYYLLVRSLCQDGLVTTGVTHTFWFPDTEVRAGDFVVVYTKAGIERHKPSEGGATSHFFYWHQAAPLWRTNDHAAVVLHAPEWISLTP